MGATDDRLRLPDYRTLLIENFWEYCRRHLTPFASYLDRSSSSIDRPPVLKKEHASRNVLLRDATAESVNEQILATIPKEKRHRWFRSMASSQALTQSVFGNLTGHRKLDRLRVLTGDDGRPLFIRDPSHSRKCHMEYEVDFLGEKPTGRTSIDVLFDGGYRIAVECKLGETEIGSCSRPRLRPNHPNYEEQFCNGRYELQLDRSSRCSLTEFGIKYWSYIPELFDWSAKIDHAPCPVNSTYQLVRNLLSVCVDPTRGVRLNSGHVVLLYDGRNPAFQGDGVAITAWNRLRAALKKQSLMQKCTWQELLACLRGDTSLDWLTTGLASAVTQNRPLMVT